MKNEEQTIERRIEAMAIEMIDCLRGLVDNPRSQGAETGEEAYLRPGYQRRVMALTDQLAILANEMGIETAIQTFAGSLTEHTMGIVREGGAKRGEIQEAKIPASRGEMVERNGNTEDLPS